MRKGVVQLRLSTWHLVVVLGGLFVIFAPIRACAQSPGIIGKCEGNPIEIASSKMKLCIKEEETTWVWMKGKTGFRAMANACCIEARKLTNAWTEQYKPPHPLVTSWYPIEVSRLKPEYQRLVEPSGTSSTVLVSRDSPQDSGTESTGGGVGTPAKPIETTANQKPSGENQKPRPSDHPDHRFLWIVAVALCALFVATFFLTLWMFFKVKKAHTASPAGSKNPNRQPSPPGQEELVAFAAALTEPLAENLRQAIPQRIFFELVPPPTTKLSDWEPFLKKLGEVLGDRTPVPPVPITATGGSRTDAPKPSPQRPAVPGAVARGTSAGRRYVQRDTAYGTAAKNFGGDSVFQETANDRAGFYIEPGEQGMGCL